MDKLKRFIQESYNAGEVYKMNIEEKINICMGNVSCDMDSAIGSIILAYYLTYKQDYWNDYGNYDNLWIPVINCPRKELIARIDIAHHLKKCNIDMNQLIYVDDLDIDFYSQNGFLQIALMDHNKLDLSEEKWGNSVVFVVDHHVDMKEYPNAEKRIQACGSASSLAINMIFDNNLENILTREICTFFAAPILMDTANFKPELRGIKWNEIDETAIMRISRISVAYYYNLLLTKKIDRKLNMELGLDLVLKKDYKNYEWKDTNAGISVVFNPIHEIMGTFGVEEVKKQLKLRMDEFNLSVYIIISQIYLETGEAFRELMIYHEKPILLQQVTSMFEKACTFPYQKKKFTGMSKVFAFYLLKDSSVSRKKIEPILKGIFESIS